MASQQGDRETQWRILRDCVEFLPNPTHGLKAKREMEQFLSRHQDFVGHQDDQRSVLYEAMSQAGQLEVKGGKTVFVCPESGAHEWRSPRYDWAEEL